MCLNIAWQKHEGKLRKKDLEDKTDVIQLLDVQSFQVDVDNYMTESGADLEN